MSSNRKRGSSSSKDKPIPEELARAVGKRARNPPPIPEVAAGSPLDQVEENISETSNSENENTNDNPPKPRVQEIWQY